MRSTELLSLQEQRYLTCLLGIIASLGGSGAVLLHLSQRVPSLELLILSSVFTGLGVCQLLLARFFRNSWLVGLTFITVPILFVGFWFCLASLGDSSMSQTAIVGLLATFPVLFCLQFVLLRPSDAFFWTATEIALLVLLSVPRAITTQGTSVFLSGSFLPFIIFSCYGANLFLLKYVADLVRKLRAAKEETAQLEEVAFYDVLTGLLNRRGMETFLVQVMADAKRTGDVFSIALLDLDHFKAINDTYGHLVGDEMLRQFAGQFKTSLRAGDVLGRWGGEEFLLITLHTPASLHATLAHRLKKSWQHPTVTFSAGLAAFQKEDTLQNLIQRADESLYLAKSRGRDRVEWAHTEVETREDGALLKN
jgi:diguanylate cyclase (GGDEF)-like protein